MKIVFPPEPQFEEESIIAFFVEYFRPSELKVLYTECEKELTDEGDLWKMRLIDVAHKRLLGKGL